MANHRSLNAESESSSYLQSNLHLLLAKANMVCELPADRLRPTKALVRGDSASPLICSESELLLLEMIKSKVVEVVESRFRPGWLRTLKPMCFLISRSRTMR